MIQQFKPLLIAFSLLFVIVGLHSQDSLEHVNSAKIDSLEEAISFQIDSQVNSLYYQFNAYRYQQKIITDSLMNLSEDKILEIYKLNKEIELLKQQLADSDRSIASNKELYNTEKQRLIRLLSIAGPSILFLILISTGLFLLLLLKQQNKMERKMNTLRRYTHSEIAVVRDDLMGKLKRRMKKMASSIGKKSSGKKGKKKK